MKDYIYLNGEEIVVFTSHIVGLCLPSGSWYKTKVELDNGGVIYANETYDEILKKVNGEDQSHEKS